MISWISSWATTLRIKFFERDTYRLLTEWTDDDPYDNWDQ